MENGKLELAMAMEGMVSIYVLHHNGVIHQLFHTEGENFSLGEKKKKKKKKILTCRKKKTKQGKRLHPLI